MAADPGLFHGCSKADIHGTQTSIITVIVPAADRTLTDRALVHLALSGLPVAFSTGTGESIIAQVKLIGAESVDTEVFGAGICVAAFFI